MPSRTVCRASTWAPTTTWSSRSRSPSCALACAPSRGDRPDSEAPSCASPTSRWIRVKREVRRAGRRLDLTAREYGFLDFLLRHAGETLTRAEILDGVWGEGAEPYGNVVDLYIHYLRAKTEAHGARLIHTVRGLGYVLREPDLA